MLLKGFLFFRIAIIIVVFSAVPYFMWDLYVLLFCAFVIGLYALPYAIYFQNAVLIKRFALMQIIVSSIILISIPTILHLLESTPRMSGVPSAGKLWGGMAVISFLSFVPIIISDVIIFISTRQIKKIH